jgi:hypothetical protein
MIIDKAAKKQRRLHKNKNNNILRKLRLMCDVGNKNAYKNH